MPFSPLTSRNKPLQGSSGSTSRWRRFLHHPIARILMASLAMFAALASSFALLEAVLPRNTSGAWANLMAALACGLGYWLYVSQVERRPVVELSGVGALSEWACGAGLGTFLGLLAIAPLWVSGVYRVDGTGDGFRLLHQVPEMLLVSVMEELLIRAIVFRIAEQAWGTRRALVLSTVIFVAAHLPGGISLVGMLVTAAASIAFTAAYQLTRRVWLPVGMHFAWNYLFSAVFSVPVSGHPAKGWLAGSMSGPDWLTGGVYGIEASASALVVWSVAGAVLLWRAHAKGQFIPRQPSR